MLALTLACSSAGNGGGAPLTGGTAGAAGSIATGGTTSSGGSGGAAGSPSGGAAGAAGGGSGGFVPSTSNDAWLVGEIDTSDTIEIARLDLPSKTKTKLPITAVEAHVDPSRDGKSIAVALRDAQKSISVALYTAGGVEKLELYALANKEVPQYVSAFRHIAVSPDGEHVAFSVLGDAPAYTYDLYLAPADGSTPAAKISTGLDVVGFRFDRDGSRLAFWDYDTLMLHDLGTSSATELGAGKLWEGSLAVDFDATGRVYFLAGTPARVHRAAKGGVPEELSATALTAADGSPADVTGLALAPSGDKLAFSGAKKLLVMDVDSTSAQAHYAPGSDGSYGGSFAWSPKGDAIAALAGYKIGSTVCNSIVHVSLGGSATRLLDVTWNKGGASSVQFSTDGSRIFFRSDMVSYGHMDVYSTSAFSTKDQDYAGLIVESVPLKASVEVVPAH